MQDNNREIAQRTLESLKPHRGNLVLRILLDHMHFGAFGVAITAFVSLCVINVLLNILQGTLWPRANSSFAALWDFRFATHWTSVPFLYPALAGVAVTIYRQIPQAFSELINSGVLVIKDHDSSYFIRLQRRYQSKTMSRILALSWLALVIGWAAVAIRQDSANWTHEVPGRLTIAGWYWILIGSVAVYVVAHLVYSIFVTYGAVRELFGFVHEFTVSLKFMHPDRCSGLRPLNRIVLTVGLFLALLGLADGLHILCSFYRYSTIGEFAQQIGPLLCIILYLLCAPLVFFLPLLPAHRMMRESKQAFQMHISRDFDRRFGHLGNRLAMGELDDAAHTQLEVLSNSQRYVDSFPVWPFNVRMLCQFTVMVVLPILLTAIGLLLQKLLL